MATDAKPTIRAGIYCRISNKDDLKIEDQETDCRALAQREGYEVVAVYVDNGISAYTGKPRPGWNEMLADCSADKLDVLLAIKHDRFSRHPGEKEVLKLICVAKRITWHFDQDGRQDPSTAEGEYSSYVDAALAKRESRVKGDRQTRANAKRRIAGRPMKVGPRPFGFEKDRITWRRNEAAAIRWATLYVIAHNGGLYTVAKRFNERVAQMRGVNGWSNSSLRSLLVRGRNAGVVEYRGKEVSGAVAPWQPIVTREQLLTVRTILQPKKKKDTRTPTHAPTSLLGGIATCACRAKLLHSGRNVYRCTKSLRANRNGQTHTQISQRVLEPLVIDNVLHEYLNHRDRAMRGAGGVEAQALSALYVQRSQAEQAIERLKSAVKRGTFTEEEIDADVAKERAKIAAAEQAIARAVARSANAAMIAATWDELDGSVGGTYAHVTYVGSDAEHVVELSGLVRHSEQQMGMSHQEAVESVRLFAKFTGLDLEQKRNLIKSLFRITVHPGVGTGRVKITRQQGACCKFGVAS